MIRFEYKAENGRVYVHQAASPEDKARLKTLLRETEIVCQIVGEKGKTGLRIVDSFDLDGQFLLIVSLEKKVELSEEELELIKGQVKSGQTK